jgi:NAD(P)-dependent dehydrogenase (short-subunit alcohol dehydrogenase family)
MESGMNDFKGRVAVITGAADGLGREFARLAAAHGMKLVLADLDADALERATDELLAGGAEVLAMVCDVRKCSHVEELADAAMIRFHGVHLLFNNDCAAPTATGAIAGRSWEMGEAEWERVLGVNLWGVIHGVRIFTPLMLDCARRDPSYRGHIVNTASMAGQGALAVARQAVLALTETLHAELRDAGAAVGASVLCPEGLPMGAPADVARIAFDAIRRGQLHIVPGNASPEGA